MKVQSSELEQLQGGHGCEREKEKERVIKRVRERERERERSKSEERERRETGKNYDLQSLRFI